MNCKKIILIILFIFLGGLCSVEKGVAIEDNREWKGNISDQKTKYIKFIRDNEEWVELWERAFDKKAPEVDFKNYAVACVFLGHKADWLYSIGFGKPFERDGSMIVQYSLMEIILELAGPFRASGQYSMKVFEKRKVFEMILEEAKH